VAIRLIIPLSKDFVELTLFCFKAILHSPFLIPSLFLSAVWRDKRQQFVEKVDDTLTIWQPRRRFAEKFREILQFFGAREK